MKIYSGSASIAGEIICNFMHMKTFADIFIRSLLPISYQSSLVYNNPCNPTYFHILDQDSTAKEKNTDKY